MEVAVPDSGQNSDPRRSGSAPAPKPFPRTSPVIEVEAHNLLRRFVHSLGDIDWPHHLTMARLVARALRLGRSALIQTGVPPESLNHSYRFSYLIPVLVWGKASVIVAPEAVVEHLLAVEFSRLRHLGDGEEVWRLMEMPIRRGDRWPDADYQGLLLTTPEAWLDDRLGGRGNFPPAIPTILDCADDLERRARDRLTARLHGSDWRQLIDGRPEWRDLLQDAQVRLIKSAFARPPNLYGCHLLDEEERQILEDLFVALRKETGGDGGDRTCSLAESEGADSPWNRFWHQWQSEDQLRWVGVDRDRGALTFYCSPMEVASALRPVWEKQPSVLIGGALDLDKNAPIYRQVMGLGEITGVKFSPDRQTQLIQLYLPSGIPMPNTPQFEAALIRELRTLLSMSAGVPGPRVLLVEDVPLRGRVGAVLASEFGSQVRVETAELGDRGILVAGWQFWQTHRHRFAPPHLLAIATLPLPSLEHPLVAGRVAYHKRRREDWFRLYLLPTALQELQRAVAPVRETQGVVALLDTRVLHRSYGKQVLAALSPHAQIDYLDTTWLNNN